VTTLFLFAHQDDEFGVFHEISSTLARGERAVCMYLTNGAWKQVTPGRRNAESANVLARIGVPPSDSHFLGTDLVIPDSQLADNFSKCFDGVVKRIEKLGGVDRIVMHAWEGGHHDHDAGHLIGAALAAKLNILDKCRQFPLYRAPGGRLIVTWAAPLEENGPVTRSQIPWAQRLRYLAFLRFYSSQLTTIVKIGPLMAWDYLTDGCQKLQPVSLERLRERPKSGELLYETWKLYSYDKFSHNAEAFIASQEALSSAATTPRALRR
jgi:N-acetylglucosamine malate deacetylase 1